MSEESTQALANMLRRHAMDSLARREHSRYELSSKLRKRFPEADGKLLDKTLDRLEIDGLLSDERFTEAYVRYRRNRGFGPVAIRHHLRACQVSDAHIASYLTESDPDWLELLEALYIRKSGRNSAENALNAEGRDQMLPEAKHRQKLERFFLSRGFTPEQIRQLWRKGNH